MKKSNCFVLVDKDKCNICLLQYFYKKQIQLIVIL